MMSSGVLIETLPTKSGIESLILRLEDAHRQDLQAVKADVQSLFEHLTSGESSLNAPEQRVVALETMQDSQVDAAVSLQLHLEDRSRQKNLRLRGLPVATGAQTLPDHAMLSAGCIGTCIKILFCTRQGNLGQWTFMGLP